METFAPGPQISRLLLDYAEYASIQHNSIQQAQDDQEEIRWRLAAIDAASRFVDRQVKWTEAFSDEISYETWTHCSTLLPLHTTKSHSPERSFK